MTFEVEVDLAAIELYLERAGPVLLQPAAELVAQRQAERAPRDPHSHEHMADHIVIEIHGNRADIGPEKRFFYAVFDELGTEKQQAQPFIRPSVDG